MRTLSWSRICKVDMPSDLHGMNAALSGARRAAVDASRDTSSVFAFHTGRAVRSPFGHSSIPSIHFHQSILLDDGKKERKMLVSITTP